MQECQLFQMICDCLFFLCEFNTSGMIFKFSILASSHSFSALCTFNLSTKELGAKLVVGSHHLYVQHPHRPLCVSIPPHTSSHHHKYESILLPGNNKEHTTDSRAGQQHVHPDVRRQGIKEGEHARIGAVWFAVQDADT